jgi:hypothetical protein
MVVLLKLLIVVAVVGILRSSETFRRKSREFDEAAPESTMVVSWRVCIQSGVPAGMGVLAVTATQPKSGAGPESI